MEFDPALVTAWAQRDQAERLMSHFLAELAQPALDALRKAVGAEVADETAAAILRKGPSQPVFIRKNKLHIKFAVPAAGPEVFRTQFIGWGEGRFTAEARYQHPTEQLLGSLETASDQAEALGLKKGRDHSGYHWKRQAISMKSLSHGVTAFDRLVEETVTTIDLCNRSGLLQALAEHQPRTPAAVEILDEPLTELD